MYDTKSIVWIAHYRLMGNSKDNQYAFETSSNASFYQVMEVIKQITGQKSPSVTYFRGHRAPNVIIDDYQSMALAIKYHGQDAYRDGINLYCSY
ncbi:hypothetical protein INT47_010574 [Mucor saturninus]|uniref:Uncharacterized protein n=1 Tax=Mucor saturninus TaxID=64648 RepID=A0A8H7V0F6_9FUNG|nr:hypothetical protein INT47_010574 [Mucor saturninus]